VVLAAVTEFKIRKAIKNVSENRTIVVTGRHEIIVREGSSKKREWLIVVRDI